MRVSAPASRRTCCSPAPGLAGAVCRPAASRAGRSPAMSSQQGTRACSLLCVLSREEGCVPWIARKVRLGGRRRRGGRRLRRERTRKPRLAGAIRVTTGDLLPKFAELSIGPAASASAALHSLRRGTLDWLAAAMQGRTTRRASRVARSGAEIGHRTETCVRVGACTRRQRGHDECLFPRRQWALRCTRTYGRLASFLPELAMAWQGVRPSACAVVQRQRVASGIRTT